MTKYLATIFGILLLVGSSSALELDSEFSIPLKEKDRVLGSLKGNFAIYGRPRITMYNGRGKAIFSKKLKNNVKPTLSPGGKYLGLITYADRSPTDLKTMKLEIYDQSGQFIRKISKPAANSFHIMDDGCVYGVEGVEGIAPTRLHLYDQNGSLRDTITFKNYHGLRIAPSGKKFIIDKARDGLEVFDSLGQFLVSLPISKVYEFDRDDRYIGIHFDGIFRLYKDEKEIQLIETSEETMRDMVLNAEHDLVVLMANKRLEVYELSSGRLIWEMRLYQQEKWFSSLDLSSDCRFILCGVDINRGNPYPKEERHLEGYLYIVPPNGKMLVQHRETYKTWGLGLPKGVAMPGAGSIMLQTREKLEKFKIN
jgi:hypothetical protein